MLKQLGPEKPTNRIVFKGSVIYRLGAVDWKSDRGFFLLLLNREVELILRSAVVLSSREDGLDHRMFDLHEFLPNTAVG